MAEMFLDHVRLKAGVVMALPLFSHLKINSDREQFNCNFSVVTVFLCNKCSLGENAKLLSESVKYFTYPKFLSGGLHNTNIILFFFSFSGLLSMIC